MRGSTVIIRTQSYNPQPVALLSSMLASFSGSLFLGGFKKASGVLAGVAQWIECQPANQRVTSSIPSQGTCLGQVPSWGMQKATPH